MSSHRDGLQPLPGGRVPDADAAAGAGVSSHQQVSLHTQRMKGSEEVGGWNGGLLG